MLSTTVGLFRPLAASIAGPSRGFSASAIVQMQKTHSGTKKRWRMTANGLFKRGKAGKQHLNTGTPRSVLSRLAQTAYATKAQARTLRRLLPFA